MKAGRGLDALIAPKVMGRGVSAGVGGFDGGCGWHDDLGFTDSRHPRNPPYNFGEALPESNANYERVPHYSTDIAAACEVWDSLPEGYWLDLISDWHGNVMGVLHKRSVGVVHRTEWTTRPLAICFAALEAVGATP